MTELKILELKKILRCKCCNEDPATSMNEMRDLFELLADIFDYDLYEAAIYLDDVVGNIN